jgi:DNA-binding NarL/FixJ family response regulator
MAATDKVTILLADEDALRRDGLAAVLTSGSNYAVTAQASTGEEALTELRRQRPDVAVVDLNLPGLHGIEVVRRARADGLRSKIIILGGTEDAEIIREVVRAGADGYLLKNGPARHLVDAISYVRDGGQYFSPQLRRDGRDRHLLEEPPRPPSPAGTPSFAASDSAEDEREQDAPESAADHAARSRARRAVRGVPLKERLRETTSENLADRDYEIMAMMADGIRPILDRLDEIDNRVAQMEDGAMPVPSDPRGWVTTQIARSVQDPRETGMSRSVSDLEARLPRLIEEAVNTRFHQMADKLQQEIEETHVRTLENFVKNIQVKLVQRVSALEQDMSRQAQAMHQLREYSQRTEDNLSRLITGVDKLAQDLPRRLAGGGQGQASLPAPAESSLGEGDDDYLAPPPRAAAPKAAKKKVSSKKKILMFWTVVGTAAILGVVAWGISAWVSRPRTGTPVPQTTATTAGSKPPVAPGTDIPSKLQAAQESSDRKDYATAEATYKQILEMDSKNVDALKGLASVLYREDKVDESAAILERIPK